MRLNKKLLSLILAGMLSIPMFGCGNSEVDQVPPQPQVQQEKPIDEDLNDEYKAKIYERQYQSDKEQAKQLIDQVMAENFSDIEYSVVESENGLIILINIDSNDEAFTSMDEWNRLVAVMVDFDIMIQHFLQQCGLNVPTGTMVANIESDTPVLAIINGEIMLDIFNHIDKLN